MSITVACWVDKVVVLSMTTSTNIDDPVDLTYLLFRCFVVSSAWRFNGMTIPPVFGIGGG